MNARGHAVSASRRSIFKILLRGLGLGLVMPHRLPPADARSGDAETKETGSLTVRVTNPLDAETPPSEFTSFLTPTSRFFVRSHFGPPPQEMLSEATWKLNVSGLVERSESWTFKELRQLEPVTITAVLQCSGNGRAHHRPKVPGVQWDRGAVGNAQWTGVRLRDVLAKAGVRTEAHHVQFQGADRPVLASVPLFTRSIPLEKALHPDTILAYEMNGRPLPLLHGGPLRVITPGWMADSCAKWLTEITVQEGESKGFYMQTAYRVPTKPVEPGASASGPSIPVEAMMVKSLIAAPKEGSTVGLGPVAIQGVAWSGEAKVLKVEVSLDEGKTWETGRFIGEHHPYAWRQWQYIWTPKVAGPATIVCRATDERGDVQPSVSPWNPSGFLWNGWDRLTVTVAA